MSEEDVELLRAVREWRPPTTLHPMAMQAWHVYEKHGMTMPPEGVQEIRAMLDAYDGDLKGLAEACEGLTRFMLLCNAQNDEATGKKIADLMREYADLYEPFWRRVAEALDNVGSESRQAFQSFVGQVEEKKSAVQVGEKAPTGTVPLSALAPPARPPPWARKKNQGQK